MFVVQKTKIEIKLVKYPQRLMLASVLAVNLLQIAATSAATAVKTPPSRGSNQYPNSKIVYGPSNEKCEQSITKIFFCDLCWINSSWFCPGCTPESLPPPVDLGVRTGRLSTISRAGSRCFTASSEAEAKAKIPAGATDIRLSSSGTGSYCFNWTETFTACVY
jgi:hypothetical protein